MHLTREEIQTLLFADASGAATNHLDACPTCGTLANEVTLELGLHDGLTWDLAELPELPREPEEGKFDAHARALIAERLEPSALDGDPLLDTDDGMLALLRAAHGLLGVEPARLRDIADAVLVASRSSVVTVVALRERANALRRTGDLTGAIDSITRGRDAAQRLVVSDHELAIFDYIESTVRSDQGRATEARELATRSLATFDRFGDTRRALYARMVLAALDYDAGAFESARATFHSLAAPLRRLGDRAAAASVVQNAGDCSLRLGDTAPARRDLTAAREEYEAMGASAEALSISWLLARVALAEGRHDDAEEMLREVADAHDARELRLDAALARLDLVELLATTGSRDEAARIARTIAGVFATAEARGPLAEAMALLREAVESGIALEDRLREVRGVIAALKSPALQDLG